MGIVQDASRLHAGLFRARKTTRSSAAVRRGLRILRPTAEDLEGRTLMSVGLDPTYGLGGVASLVPPPTTTTTSGGTTTTTTTTTDYSENVNSIALQNGQVVGVGTLSSNTFTSGSGGSSTSTSTLIAARFNTNGSLDTSFGSGGTTSIPVTSGGTTYNVTGEDIVVQSNGLIDLLGTATPASPSTSTVDDFVVAQLNSNGSLNTSFGTSGFTLIDFSTSSTAPASGTSASALALSPNGSIVAVGTTTLSGATASSFAIARLNPNGTPDTTFNGTGVTTSSFNTGGPTNSDATASGVVVTSSGTIVVVGTVQVPSTTIFTNGSPSKSAVAALNVNGSPLSGFNGTGQLTYSYNFGGTSMDSANGVVLDGSSIAIVGTSTTLTTSTTTADAPSPSVLTVTRLTASGSFDTTFNGTGMFFGLTLNQGGVTYATTGTAITVLPDDSLLVGGSANDANNYDGPSAALLANLTPSGALNTSYGTNGVALIEPVYLSGKLLVQTDGKVLFGADGGVARTTAPAPAVVSTTIVSTGTGKKAKASGVTITFNTAVNPVLISNLTAFMVRPMKGKKAIKIKKGGIVYNPTTQTLTINFAKKMKVGTGFQVLIMPGGVVGADGQVLFNGAVTPILITPTT